MLTGVERAAARRRLRRRGPGAADAPRPELATGTDTLDEISHIVVLMMENHSYDNYLGMLAGHGDGLPLGSDGRPLPTNPATDGTPVHLRHFTGTRQYPGTPAQSWNAIDDFPFSMIDRPASGTIFDLLDAHGISWVNYHQLSTVKIRWRRLAHARGLGILRAAGALLASFFPQLIPAITSKLQVTADLFPLGFLRSVNHLRSGDQFWDDVRTGTLPAVSLVDPDFRSGSEENPQDISVGEQFAARVVNAVMAGAGWPRTLLIWLYDEHGGYYDHVPPPAAEPPDDVPGGNPLRRFPVLRLLRFTPLGRKIDADDSGPGRYDRLGFRVPAVFVSPYARPEHVTDRTYDHTSILRIIERKWNLPPLTRRDAAAADPLDDMLDLAAPPAFATPPVLPAPGQPSAAH